MSEDRGMMIEAGEVRYDGRMCEPCSDISPNWIDMRSEFGYITLYEILLGVCHEKEGRKI